MTSQTIPGWTGGKIDLYTETCLCLYRQHVYAYISSGCKHFHYSISLLPEDFLRHLNVICMTPHYGVFDAQNYFLIVTGVKIITSCPANRKYLLADTVYHTAHPSTRRCTHTRQSRDHKARHFHNDTPSCIQGRSARPGTSRGSATLAIQGCRCIHRILIRIRRCWGSRNAGSSRDRTDRGHTLFAKGWKSVSDTGFMQWVIRMVADQNMKGLAQCDEHGFLEKYSTIGVKWNSTQII